MRWNLRRRICRCACVIVVAFLSASACRDDQPLAARAYGEQLFSEPRLSDSDFNVVSCSSCHSINPAGEAERILPGHSLVNSAFRTSYWGGSVSTLFEAMNHCLVDFMRGAPLSQDDVRGRALYEFLVEKSPETSSPALPMTVVENVTVVPRGDSFRGEVVWRNACQGCHGAVHTGEGRISPLTTIIPEGSVDFAAQLGVPIDLLMIEKVRHGSYFGVGGNMPFFAKEMLSDDDLGALLAYIARSGDRPEL